MFQQDLQTIEDPVTCEVCQNTLLNLGYTLTLLSIYEEREKISDDDILCSVDIKQELDSKSVCSSDIQNELIESKSGSTKEGFSDYEQFQVKNEEIDLKMEHDQDNIEG